MNALALVPALAAVPPRPLFLRCPGQLERDYYLLIPTNLCPEAEPLVLVHGISRNAPELVLRFAELANRLGVPLIAPLFRREIYGQYQQVIDPRGGQRSDLALLDILDDAARRHGLANGRIALFGFSGGAQFAHRFAMLHADRVRVCVPSSAGWYTMPDPNLAWPMGLAESPLPIHPQTQSIPFHVIVGQRERDDDEALRRNPALDAMQGENRRARARTWHRALRRAGWNSESSLTVLPRTRHNFSCAHRNGLVETVFRLIGHQGTEQ
ncbi:MAG TPA: alpha/beta hydrolase [Novosphingobium sp.]|nr:alpha/beta hydrolase [Novosphingobium sp.]